MIEDPFVVAQRLRIHDCVHGVRAGPRKITIAHAPDERHLEGIPERLEDWIEKITEDTVWGPTVRGRAEWHSWSGGRTDNPILPSSDHPENYELQVPLVKR